MKEKEKIRRRMRDGSLGPQPTSWKEGKDWTGHNPVPKAVGKDTRERLLLALGEGLSFQKVAAYAGITYQILHDWMRHAEEQAMEFYAEWQRRGYLPSEEVPFWVQFFLDVKEAEVKGELESLKVIRKSALGKHERTEHKRFFKDGKMTGEQVTTKTAMPQWTAAAWLLEHKYPERYGRKHLEEREALPEGMDPKVLRLAQLLERLPRSELERIQQIVEEDFAKTPKRIEK